MSYASYSAMSSSPTSIKSDKFHYYPEMKNNEGSDPEVELPTLASASHRSSLLLELSSNDVLNAKWSLPNGFMMYKTTTSTKLLFPSITTLQRVSPAIQPGEDNLTTIGKVHHKAVRPSIIEFGEQSTPVNELFTRGSVIHDRSAHGRHRAFKLPDGRDVKWCLGVHAAKLVTNDSSKNLLAVFHPRCLGILTKKPKCPASFEIFPIAIDPSGFSSTDISDGVLNESQKRILDKIMITAVYIEYLRYTREQAAAAG